MCKRNARENGRETQVELSILLFYMYTKKNTRVTHTHKDI